MIRRLGWREPDQHWLYRTADGQRAFYVLRWNEPNKPKEIRPLSWCRRAEGEGWELKRGLAIGRCII
jgi:hypothetical protein